jgi:hypothetical protein
MSQPTSPNWIIVATTAGVLEAQMIAGRLESLGIPAFVSYEPAGAALGLSVGALGRADVLVPEEYFERAAALLEGGEAAERSDQDG